MYSRLFGEHKSVAVYSFFIFALLLFGVVFSNSRNTLSSQAGTNPEISRGCFYKSVCPPQNNGERTLFRCEPQLICPTPSLFVKPTGIKTVLTCNDCTSANTESLCFNPVNKSSYCSGFSTPASGGTCVKCSVQSISVTPSVGPCVKPPPCFYSVPRCLIAEPPEGWCRISPTVYPTKTVPTGYPTRTVSIFPDYEPF